MRFVIGLATTAIMFAVAEAAAEPNAVLYQLQERCGKSASEAFKKDYDNGKGSDGTRFGYQAHYNARLNKCFFLEISTSFEKEPVPKMTQMYRLFDLLENREYGSFTKDTRGGVSECIVQDTACRSKSEWDNLVKPYLDE